MNSRALTFSKAKVEFTACIDNDCPAVLFMLPSVGSLAESPDEFLTGCFLFGVELSTEHGSSYTGILVRPEGRNNLRGLLNGVSGCVMSLDDEQDVVLNREALPVNEADESGVRLTFVHGFSECYVNMTLDRAKGLLTRLDAFLFEMDALISASTS